MSSLPPVEGPSSLPRTPARWRRLLPPARLLWISLVVLGIYGTTVLHGLGEVSLVVLPGLAAAFDVAFQRARFAHLRFPDAALATGLFIALVLPPPADLLLTGTAVFAAIAVRHALRYRGHPWMNPAASGILVGTVILGLAPAWWIALGSYGAYLMIALGVVLAARTWRSWRLPVTFVVAYALFVTAQHLMVGTSISPHVLMLEAIDPVMLFFGLFLVTEPRTSPADPAGQALYAMGVALGAAMLPLVLPTVGILVALLLGNLGFLAFRWARATSLARPSARGATSKRKRDSPAAPAVRWPSAYRTGTMFLVLMVLFAVLASFPPPRPSRS